MLGRRLLGDAVVSAAECPAGSERSRVFLGKGTAHINVVETSVPDILPNIRRKSFKLSQWNEAKDFWDSSKGPVTWLLAYDFDNRTLKLIGGPVDFAGGPRRAKLLCVSPSENGAYSLRKIIE
jgi:hypothetical protein